MMIMIVMMIMIMMMIFTLGISMLSLHMRSLEGIIRITVNIVT